MSDISRAQKLRLGVFLIVAGALLAGTLVFMVGGALLRHRDEYVTRFSGSVAGLNAGAAVSYRGIVIGRVEDIRIAPDDVGQVEVVLSLDEGTPVPEDALANINMQGITGQKVIELSGGTKGARLRSPGETIESKASMLDDLTDRAASIAAKLEQLTDNIIALTRSENTARIGTILAELEKVATSVRKLVDESRPRIGVVLDSAGTLLTTVRSVTKRAEGALGRLESASDELALLIHESRGSLAALGKTLLKRLGASELGALIVEVTGLARQGTTFVDHANVTLTRAKDDLLRVLDELAEGAESFADFAAMLKTDPSSLLRGRSEKDRDLP